MPQQQLGRGLNHGWFGIYQLTDTDSLRRMGLILPGVSNQQVTAANLTPRQWAANR